MTVLANGKRVTKESLKRTSSLGVYRPHKERLFVVDEPKLLLGLKVLAATGAPQNLSAELHEDGVHVFLTTYDILLSESRKSGPTEEQVTQASGLADLPGYETEFGSRGDHFEKGKDRILEESQRKNKEKKEIVDSLPHRKLMRNGDELFAVPLELVDGFDAWIKDGTPHKNIHWSPYEFFLVKDNFVFIQRENS